MTWNSTIKRRTPLKRIGKKSQEWIDARKELYKEYNEKGITTCELRFSVCWYNKALHFAHKYKRTDPRCEHTFNQTILACDPCHGVIENDRELTDKIFKKLRPNAVDDV